MRTINAGINTWTGKRVTFKVRETKTQTQILAQAQRIFILANTLNFGKTGSRYTSRSFTAMQMQRIQG